MEMQIRGKPTLGVGVFAELQSIEDDCQRKRHRDQASRPTTERCCNGFGSSSV